MDDKKKIVLGSEDFLSKGIDDIYLNINLQQTFNQIKEHRYDNNFDLAEQFRKERNASRDFRIYGILDSTVVNTDNMTIYVYKDSNLTQLHSIIQTTPLAYSEDNVFDKRRGKFLIELNNYDADLVYFRVIGNNVTFSDQVFEQRLVFYTLDGEFVEYGTETVDIGLNNPGFLTIENNFPFFYNKHWIKKDLNIIEEKPTIMQFGTLSSSVAEGQSINFEIVMDKPSPFGNESVEMNAILGTVVPADYNITLNGSPISFPTTLNWSQGEQNKVFTFDAITDNIYEFSENIRFDLYNFNFTESGLTTSHFVELLDATPRKKTNYHFGEVYKNRLEFTGRTVQYSPATSPFRASAYSILRNGLHFENKNEAFYPGDTYEVIVKNEGTDTLLPANPSIGVNSEQIWPSNAEKIFTFDTKYNTQQKHQVKLLFPQGSVPNIGKLRINGVDMDVNILSFGGVSFKILDSSGTDYIPSQGFEKDWTATALGTSGFTITSKTPGLPVVIDIIPTSGGLAAFPSGPSPVNPSANPYVVEVTPFVESEQIPPVLSLYANADNNTKTLYSFQFVKQGYVGVTVSAKTQTATASGVDRWLVSTFEYISRNWDSVEDDCIYFSSATPEIGYPVTENGDGTPFADGGLSYTWPVGVAHINGSVFLQNNIINNSRQNLTSFKTADFKNYPLIVEPCTNEDLLPNSIKQKAKITFPNSQDSGSWCGNARVSYQTNRISFDFRTGTTGPYTTFYKTGILTNSTLSNIGWNQSVSLSGATSGSGLLKSFLNEAVGPLNGVVLDAWGGIVEVESKVAGVPFEVTNIVPNYYHTAYPGSGGYPLPTCAPVAAGVVNHTIKYELQRPSGVAGVDVNIAKNWMGGYNTDLQTGPGAGTGTIGTGTVGGTFFSGPPLGLSPSL